MPYRSFNKNKFKGDVSKARFIKYDRLVGIELEATGGDQYNAYNNIDSSCGITDDGSVTDPGIEVQTPAASADKLEYYIRSATKGLRDAGYSVDRSCGLHIHIDGEGFVDNAENTNKLAMTYYALEPMLFAMLPRSRRSNGFCRAITNRINDVNFKKFTKSPKQVDKYAFQKIWYGQSDEEYLLRTHKGNRGWDRYYGFNYACLFGLGHLELRYHHGTINAKKIRNWVRLNLFMMDWALKHYDKKALLHIAKCKRMSKKVELFYRYFRVPTKIRRYVDECIATRN
jgi:hypothetical protein